MRGRWCECLLEKSRDVGERPGRIDKRVWVVKNVGVAARRRRKRRRRAREATGEEERTRKPPKHKGPSLTYATRLHQYVPAQYGNPKCPFVRPPISSSPPLLDSPQNCPQRHTCSLLLLYKIAMRHSHPRQLTRYISSMPHLSEIYLA